VKTVILCGGLGTRLSEETQLRPKPMVTIGGKPMLLHIMNLYASRGFKDFILPAGYKSEDIKHFFLNYAALSSDFEVNLSTGKVNYISQPNVDWKVTVIDTGLQTLTGGRLLRLKSLLKDEKMFMLTYGDGLSNVDINKLVSFHKAHGKIATLTSVRPPARFGTMHFDSNGKILEFREKIQTDEGWINGGFFVFNSTVFDYLKDGDQTVLEGNPLESLAKDGQLMGFKHDGFWQCMDTIRDRQHLENLWSTGDAPWVKL
jgi:glucose-1-phosphate cytidylyltransferase